MKNRCLRCNAETYVVRIQNYDRHIALDPEPRSDGTVYVHEKDGETVAHPTASEIGRDALQQQPNSAGRMFMPHDRTCRGKP